MDTLLTLANIHPRDRVAYWHDLACKTIIKHDCRVPTSSKLDATIECMPLSELGFVKGESFGLDRIERTARHIAQGDDDIFLLCVQLRGGATLSQDGRETTCVPAILPSSTHGAPTSVTLPQAGHHQDSASRTKGTLGRELRTDRPRRARSNGIGGLTSSYTSMIAERLETLQLAPRPQIAEHVLDLIALSLACTLGNDQPNVSSAAALALLQLRASIESRLSDPAFDPRAAAEAAGISVRYANSLLSQQSTSLERLIVSRRLKHCRRALEDPGQSQCTITDIAFGWASRTSRTSTGASKRSTDAPHGTIAAAFNPKAREPGNFNFRASIARNFFATSRCPGKAAGT